LCDLILSPPLSLSSRSLCSLLSPPDSDSPTRPLPFSSAGFAGRSGRGRGARRPLPLCTSKNSGCVPVFRLFAVLWASSLAGLRSRRAFSGDLHLVLAAAFVVSFDVVVRSGGLPLNNLSVFDLVSPDWLCCFSSNKSPYFLILSCLPVLFATKSP